MKSAGAGQQLRGRRSSAWTAVVLLTLLSFASTACTTVYNVPKRELAKLNGFREEKGSFLSRFDPRPSSAPHYLIDEDGRGHAFNSSSRLVLDVRTPYGRAEIEARYRQITVEPDLFLGLTRESREIRVPLGQVDRAGLRKFSGGKTAGLVTGIVGTGLLIALIISLSLPASNGSHHDWD
jgi:hypothetical protein